MPTSNIEYADDTVIIAIECEWGEKYNNGTNRMCSYFLKQNTIQRLELYVRQTNNFEKKCSKLHRLEIALKIFGD